MRDEAKGFVNSQGKQMAITYDLVKEVTAHLYERSLKHYDWIRVTCPPCSEDRDGDADAREQYHPSEGDKDLSEAA